MQQTIKNHIKEILTPKRYEHSLLVAETAKILAEKYKISLEKAEIAGLLHDCAKDISIEKMKKMLKNEKAILEIADFQPQILHGFAGAVYARNVFRIEDIEILDAIKYHTVGRRNMSLLDKVIYVADIIEPSRKCSKIDEIRIEAEKNIDDAILKEIENKIAFLISKNIPIHINTIEMRNYIIEKKKVRSV